MADAKTFFDLDQQKRIETAIAEAEKNTSGEIRVHIENNCTVDAVERAVKVFEQIKMHETKERNGVLVYLAVVDHKFAIVGDKGINDVVPNNFWDNIKTHMQSCFKEKEFTKGLCEGIIMAGNELKKHFPLQHDDKDELSNDVTFNHN